MSRSSVLARTLTAVGVGLLVLSPLDAALGAPAAAAPGGATWVTHPLPPAAGTGLSRNEDGEPGAGVTPSGQFWTASDIAPYAAHDPRVDPAAGLLSGADIWTSTDGGRTYTWVADPFAAASNTAGLAGEDTDLTVAPEKNSKGFYNVYAASLWIGSTSLAWSDDGGKTWSVNPLGGVPAQDRPWLTADGPCTVHVIYHQLPLFTPTVSAYDVCSNGNVPVSNGAALPGVSRAATGRRERTAPTRPARQAGRPLTTRAAGTHPSAPASPGGATTRRWPSRALPARPGSEPAHRLWTPEAGRS